MTSQSDHDSTATCAAIRARIEEPLFDLTLDAEAKVRAHLETCPDCAAFYHLELALREVIAPTDPPRPGPGFERELAARLGLTPVAAPQRRRALTAINPGFRWDWAAGLALALLLSYLVRAAETIRAVGELGYAKIAATLAGQSALLAPDLIGIIPGPPGLKETLLLSLMLGVISALVGRCAVKLALRN